MKVTSFIGGVLGGLLAIIGVGILVFLQSVFAVLFGWLFGFFVAWLFGGYIPDGINSLFGTSVTTDSLPQISAALWFLGSILGFRKPKLDFNKKQKSNNPNITINN